MTDKPRRISAMTDGKAMAHNLSARAMEEKSRHNEIKWDALHLLAAEQRGGLMTGS